MQTSKTFALVAMVCCALLSCKREGPRGAPAGESRAREQSQEIVDPSTKASIKQEIIALRSQIAQTETESERYSGGLVKALIESRAQTQKQTLAMLEQRDRAWTFGLDLRFTVDGKPFVLPSGANEQLPEIERELRETATKIEAQRNEVARYSGGLIQALSLSTLETLKQTQAMLEQRRLAIKYQLPQYLAFQNQAGSSPSSTAVTTTIPTSSPVASAGDDWEIVAVASRPGESNSTWTRFAWKLTIRNKSQSPQEFDATIEFRDSESFPVDSATAYDLIVPAASQETFTGEKLITANQVGRISETVAKVKKSR